MNIIFALLRTQRISDIMRIENLHDARVPYHNIRPTFNYTWLENKHAVESSGYSWCTLQRDNWSCMGRHYRKALKSLEKTDARLDSIAPNARLLAEGNSYFAEVVLTLVCNTPKVIVYKFNGNHTNSFIAYSPTNNVTLLLVDNDVALSNWGSSGEPLLLTYLHETRYSPTSIVLSDLNTVSHIDKRVSTFTRRFPTANVTVWANPTHEDGALKSKDGHWCMPGYVNILARDMLGVLNFSVVL